jgi:hypothetical protein
VALLVDHQVVVYDADGAEVWHRDRPLVLTVSMGDEMSGTPRLDDMLRKMDHNRYVMILDFGRRYNGVNNTLWL